MKISIASLAATLPDQITPVANAALAPAADSSASPLSTPRQRLLPAALAGVPTTSKSAPATPIRSPRNEVCADAANQSPYQNKSSSRTALALFALGIPGKPLQIGNGFTLSGKDGGGDTYHLKYAIQYSEKEIDAQFAEKRTHWESSSKKYKKRNADKEPIREQFEPVVTNLINLQIEIHPGGANHSNGQKNVGSYIKAKGYYRDHDGKKVPVETRAGRRGRFNSDQTFDGQVHDPVLTEINMEKQKDIPRRLAIQTHTPSMRQEEAVRFLTTLILQPEIVTRNLDAAMREKMYAELESVTQRQARVKAGEASESAVKNTDEDQTEPATVAGISGDGIARNSSNVTRENRLGLQEALRRMAGMEEPEAPEER